MTCCFYFLRRRFIPQMDPDDIVRPGSPYAYDNYSSVNKWGEALLRDYFFVGPSSRVVELLGQQGVPVWQYQFDYRWLVPNGHAVELPFVWDTIKMPTKNQIAMRNSFGSYFWRGMTGHGDPSMGSGHEIQWPAATGSTPSVRTILPCVPCVLLLTMCPFSLSLSLSLSPCVSSTSRSCPSPCRAKCWTTPFRKSCVSGSPKHRSLFHSA